MVVAMRAATQGRVSVTTDNGRVLYTYAGQSTQASRYNGACRGVNTRRMSVGLRDAPIQQRRRRARWASLGSPRRWAGRDTS